MQYETKPTILSNIILKLNIVYQLISNKRYKINKELIKTTF